MLEEYAAALQIDCKRKIEEIRSLKERIQMLSDSLQTLSTDRDRLLYINKIQAEEIRLLKLTNNLLSSRINGIKSKRKGL